MVLDNPAVVFDCPATPVDNLVVGHSETSQKGTASLSELCSASSLAHVFLFLRSCRRGSRRWRCCMPARTLYCPECFAVEAAAVLVAVAVLVAGAVGSSAVPDSAGLAVGSVR